MQEASSMGPPNSRKERTEEREQRRPEALYYTCISISTDQLRSAMRVLFLHAVLSNPHNDYGRKT